MGSGGARMPRRPDGILFAARSADVGHAVAQAEIDTGAGSDDEDCEQQGITSTMTAAK